jgi:pilus assembly protein CpaE
LSANILLVSLGGRSAERMRDQLSAHGYAVELVGGPSAASHGGRSDLLIVDTAAPAVALDTCRRLRSQVGPDVPILAVAPSERIEDRIALFEAGADDVLSADAGAREVEAIVEALLARRGPVPAADDRPGDHTDGPSRLAGGNGRLIVFAANKGGAGTTTLAVNTAVVLAQAGADVALVDLDLHHGQVGTHLDVSAAHSTAQLARDEQAASDPALLRPVAASHASGLSVFTAPARPDEGALVGADDVLELVGGLRRGFATVVVDAGSTMGSRAIGLVAAADSAVLVITPDIPSLGTARGALEAMGEAGAHGDHVRFVLNQPFAEGAIAADDIERHLGVKLEIQLPFDGANAVRSVNEGKPLTALAPRSALSEGLRRLAHGVGNMSPPAGAEERPERGPGGRFGGLLRRG